MTTTHSRVRRLAATPFRPPRRAVSRRCTGASMSTTDPATVKVSRKWPKTTKASRRTSSRQTNSGACTRDVPEPAAGGLTSAASTPVETHEAAQDVDELVRVDGLGQVVV